jgi:benzoyl-CoA reductase/2-hydroxyglutaryl-CoA dehydratase subunit BcrC/BadD/HgdB
MDLIKTSDKAQAYLIGYTCPYIPVEIIAATGLRPYCLLHGNYDLMQQGTLYARVDACPLVRSNLAYVINNQKNFAALIGTTGCDMSHRMFDILSEHTDTPLFVLHMPRTDNREIFYDEIDWLIGQLEELIGKKIKTRLGEQARIWETVRNRYRKFDEKRSAVPSVISSSDFHLAAKYYYQGKIRDHLTIATNDSSLPRVYLIGSEISYESNNFLELLETRFRIVGDFTCGISQFLNVTITEPDLNSIKRTYYDQTPCPYRRPNNTFYEYIADQINKRKCDGLVGYTLDYCDAYEFEMKHLETILDKPVLRIRNDYSFQKISQLKTRIAAFGELLCSKM